MREEMNHLIEYFTVLKKAGQIIFGEEEIDKAPMQKLGLGVQADDPEERLMRERRAAGSESDNSDDYLFGNESKYLQRKAGVPVILQ